MAKCSRSNTHLFRTESPAFDKVLMSVPQRTGIGLGCASRCSRSVLSTSACSFESEGAARAADNVWRGSKGAVAMLFVQLLKQSSVQLLVLLGAICRCNPQQPAVHTPVEAAGQYFGNFGLLLHVAATAGCRCDQGQDQGDWRQLRTAEPQRSQRPRVGV